MASRRKSSDRWTDARAVIECNRRNWSLIDANIKGVCDPRTKRWISASHDFLGIFDGVATPLETGGLVAIQWTSASNFAARIKKIEQSGKLPWLAKAGVAVVVWGFRRDRDDMREKVLLSGRVPGLEELVA